MAIAMKHSDKPGGSSLITPSFIVSVGAVREFGARKYAAWDWLKGGLPISRYLDAIDRHRLALVAGEDLDPESKLHHGAHIACNCMFLIEGYYASTLGVENTMRVIDDRNNEKMRMLTVDQVGKLVGQAVK